MEDKFKKMDEARHLLPPPGAEVVGECLDKIKDISATKQQLAEMLLKALVALGKRHLKEAHEENIERGEPNTWPTSSYWKAFNGTSHSIFLEKARDEADIDFDEYINIIRDDKDIDLDKLWEEIC